MLFLSWSMQASKQATFGLWNISTINSQGRARKIFSSRVSFKKVKGESIWESAQRLGEETRIIIMVRAPCCDKVGLKKGPWTSEEDQILISYIQNYGHDNWRALPKHAGNYKFLSVFLHEQVQAMQISLHIYIESNVNVSKKG